MSLQYATICDMLNKYLFDPNNSRRKPRSLNGGYVCSACFLVGKHMKHDHVSDIFSMKISHKWIIFQQQTLKLPGGSPHFLISSRCQGQCGLRPCVAMFLGPGFLETGYVQGVNIVWFLFSQP